MSKAGTAHVGCGLTISSKGLILKQSHVPVFPGVVPGCGNTDGTAGQCHLSSTRLLSSAKRGVQTGPEEECPSPQAEGKAPECFSTSLAWSLVLAAQPTAAGLGTLLCLG